MSCSMLAEFRKLSESFVSVFLGCVRMSSCWILLDTSSFGLFVSRDGGGFCFAGLRSKINVVSCRLSSCPSSLRYRNILLSYDFSFLYLAIVLSFIPDRHSLFAIIWRCRY